MMKTFLSIYIVPFFSDTVYKRVPIPAGKIAEKAMWRSVLLIIWHRILNTDSIKNSLLQCYFFCNFAGWDISDSIT